MNENTSISEYTSSPPPKRSWTRLFLITLAGAFVGLIGLVAITLLLEGSEGLVGSDDPKPEVIKPPPTATEIITDEFTGKIETAPVQAEELAQPPPGELPTTSQLESRDFEDESTRNVSAVDQSLTIQLDKATTKISKNLDKKKVLKLLAKKLDGTCQPALPADTKSLKAEIKLSKTGRISNIKVTPGAVEKELAKCMRKKLGDAKELKPKNKSTAQITVNFKIK